MTDSDSEDDMFPELSREEESSDLEVEEFSDDEELIRDTTAAQLLRGKDIQGIPWELTQYTREAYRRVRNSQYRNYYNLEEEVIRAQPGIDAEAVNVKQAIPPYYDFCRNWRGLRSTIMHFQLRHLLWATTAHDLYTVFENRVVHWDTVRRRRTTIMDVSGGARGATAPNLGTVQVCTLCVREGLVAAGGFGGELVARRVGSTDDFNCSQRLSNSENGITNAIEIARSAAGGLRVICSNNDCAVRVLDAERFKLLTQIPFDWAVNCTVVQPGGGKLMGCVGDDPAGLLLDASSGARVAQLRGHCDFSFAAAWHPDGNVIASGNQDMTTRLWDVRHLATSLAVLKAHIGAVRSLRYSPCGRFLAVAEPADYVTLYDVAQGCGGGGKGVRFRWQHLLMEEVSCTCLFTCKQLLCWGFHEGLCWEDGRTGDVQFHRKKAQPPMQPHSGSVGVGEGGVLPDLSVAHRPHHLVLSPGEGSTQPPQQRQ